MPKKENKVAEYKKPKNSIPTDGDVIVKSLIYSVDYTKSAKERANDEGREPNLLDGIAINLVHLTCWDKTGKERKLVEYANATNPKEVQFPCDITLPDGTKDYCYITNAEYLNVSRLTSKSMFGGFIKPNTEAEALLLYDASLGAQFGIDSGEIADAILISDITKISDEELDKVGMSRPTVKQFPILTNYRYLDSYDNKKTLKKELKWVITGYNRTSKKMDLGGSSAVEWLPEDKALMIYEALTDRTLEKDIAKGHPF